ncbi:MAG: hypothetical protein IPO27_17270 [Bacteroidetes bacterium]|nr:hypothetical protein [Bacteroidota bacterium]
MERPKLNQLIGLLRHALCFVSAICLSTTQVKSATITDPIGAALTTNHMWNTWQMQVMYPASIPTSNAGSLPGNQWSVYASGCVAPGAYTPANYLQYNSVNNLCTGGIDTSCAYISSAPLDFSGRGGAAATVNFWLYHETFQNTRFGIPAAFQNRQSDTVQVYVSNSTSVAGATLIGTTWVDTIGWGAGNAWRQHSYSIPPLAQFNGCAPVYIIIMAKTWDSRRNIYMDQISFDHFPTRMAITSANIHSQNTLTVSPGSTNNLVIGVKVTTCGSLPSNCGGIARLDSMYFLATGTNIPNDVANAKLFFTGTSPIFSSAMPVFGAPITTLANAGPYLAFGTTPIGGPGAVNLVMGDNYFWLTYDIKTSPPSTPGNIVDADFIKIVGDTCGTVFFNNGTAGSLPGGSIIGVSYCTGSYTVGTAFANYTVNDYIGSVYVSSIGGGDPLLSQYHDNTIPYNTNGSNPICSGVGGAGGQWCDRHAPHNPDYTLFPPTNSGSGKDRTLILKAGQGIRTGSASEEICVAPGTWFSANTIKMWIDWNGDGDFNDSINGVGGWISETIGFTGNLSANSQMSVIGYPAKGAGRPFNPAYQGVQWYALPLNVPNIGDVVTGGVGPFANFTSKTVRLRVREVFAGSSGFITPCSIHTFGETEDYDVTIVEDCPLPGSKLCKWLGGTPGNPADWFTATNWCPGIPTANDTALITPVTLINGLANYPIITTNQNPVCATLKIYNPATVTIDAPQQFVAGNPNATSPQSGTFHMFHNVLIGDQPLQTNPKLIVNSAYNKTVVSGVPSAVGQTLISPFRPDRTDNKFQYTYTPSELQVMGLESGDQLMNMAFTLRNSVAMLSAPNGKTTIRMWQTDATSAFPLIAPLGVEVAVNNTALTNIPAAGVINNPVTVLNNTSIQLPALPANTNVNFTINFSSPYVLDVTKFLTVEITKDSSFVGGGTPAFPVLYEATIGRSSVSIIPTVNAASALAALTIGGAAGGLNTNGTLVTGTNAPAFGGGVLSATTFSFRPTTTFGVTRSFDDYTIEVNHNWINNGLPGGTNFVRGNSLVKFLNTTAPGFGNGDSIMGTQVTTFNKLEMSDAVGIIMNVTGNIVGGGAYPFNNSGIIIDSNLICTNGSFNLSQHLMTVNNSLTNAITRTGGHILSERSDNYNRVKWKIGTNNQLHTFPFGTPTGYIPFSFQLKSNTFGDVVASTYGTASNNLPWPSTPTFVNNLYNQKYCIADNSPSTVDRFWQLDVSNPGGGGVAKMEFTYLPSELTGNLNMASVPMLRASRYEASTPRAASCFGVIPGGFGVWGTPQNGYSIASLTNPNQTTGPAWLGNSFSVQVDSVTQFSPWTLSSMHSPLPLNLLSFNAKAIEEKVKVYWSATGDEKLQQYIVEKSTDQDVFNFMNAKPALLIGTIHNYETFDISPIEGINYYRLKMIDYSGDFGYSEVIPVMFGKSDFAIVGVAPQQEHALIVAFNYNSELPYNYTMMDLMGRIISKGEHMLATKGRNEIRLPFDAARGVYLISIYNEKEADTRKFNY